MMGRLNTTNARGGFTVLYAVLVASLVLAIGAVVFSITFRELILTSQTRDSNKAFYAADSAIECALYWDTKHPGFPWGVFGGLTKGGLDQDLAGWWKLDDGSGFSAIDSSGSGNTGNLMNMEESDWVGGQLNNALDFDGVNEYVQVSGLMGTLPNITLSAWANLEASDSNGAELISLGDAVSIRLDASSGQTYAFYYDGAGWRQTGSGVTHSGTGWHHFAYTFDDAANTQILYIDGDPVNTTNYSGSISYTLGSNTFIGKHGNGGSNHDFNGVIDDVRIYTKALPPGDIQDLYDGIDQVFKAPVSEDSDVFCIGEDITEAASGWDSGSGWDQILDLQGSDQSATTTFDILFNDASCASVTVSKDNTGYGRFDARGYNTCDLNNPRRIERGLRVTY